jgi:hypothetical protein
MALAIRKIGTKTLDLWCGRVENFTADCLFTSNVELPDYESLKNECREGSLRHVAIVLSGEVLTSEALKIKELALQHLKSPQDSNPMRLTLLCESLASYEKLAETVEKLKIEIPRLT